MAASFTPGVGSSVVIPRPAINWGELSSPLETTAKKVSRHFGQLLVVLGVFAGVGRQLAAARMTASPDTIIRTCATLQVVMLVSLVVGAALWFFNRLTQAPSELLLQRGEVANQIEKIALADLRETYKSLFVLSDPELNQWIRYLSGTAPFNDFMAKQSDKIFTLRLEDETIKLLKDRYLLDVNHEAIPRSFKSFIDQKRFQFLLSESERVDVMKLVANREAARVGVCTVDTYKTFIDAQGVSILSYLNLENLPPLALAFQDEAKSSGVGIRDLKKNRAGELQAFGAKIETELFQHVANRDGLQAYEIFREKNGDEAIGYITNTEVKEGLFQSFSNFVVGKKYGLVKARKDFERTIGMFGKSAAERIDFLVLTDEIGALVRGDFTYLIFRQRNGIENIHLNTLGNSNLIQLLKPYFLKLPASDLIYPDYKIDRELFGITMATIKSELLRRWDGMTVAGILRTDRDGFVATVAGPCWCFYFREWTEKAVLETTAMSIKDILSTYRVLFEIGTLVAADGDFINRLDKEIASITEWTMLIDTYGAFVFEQGLLVASQVEYRVRNFIWTHAESYLNDSFEGTMLKYVEVIEKYCLNDRMAQTIQAAKATVAAEKQRQAKWLKSYEADFEKKIQARQKKAEQEIADFQTDHQITQKEKEKNAADRKWTEKKAAYEALCQGMKASQEEITRNQEKLTQKGVALQELRSKLANIPADTQWNRIQAEETLRLAQRNLLNAEALVRPLYAPLIDLQEMVRELQKTLQINENMQREHDTLLEEVNKAAFALKKKEQEEMEAHPNNPVKGLEAAEKAKKAVQEAPNRLIEMRAKETRVAELAIWISQTNSEQIRATLSQIISAKEGTESTLASAEVQAQLSQWRAEESVAREAVRQWIALEGDYLALSLQIASLSLDIDELCRQINQKSGALEEKKKRCNESLEQLRAAEAKKTTTEKVYNICAQKLAGVTAEIRQKCREDIESMGKKKTQSLSQAQSTNVQKLQDIVKNFRSLM